MGIKGHRKINLALLSFLLASCVFFSFFDILYIKIWWTIPVIYIPCIFIFSGGIFAWYQLNINYLKAIGIILVLVSSLLVGYGVWLSVQGDLFWGALTLIFATILSAMAWSSFKARSLLAR